jgi:hypothetical protein
MKMRLRDESVQGIKPEILALAEKHVERKMAVEAAIRGELQRLQPSYETSDPAKRAAQEDAFVNSLAARLEFAVDEAGMVTLFENGSRLEDRQGYPVQLRQIVRESAEAMYTLVTTEKPGAKTPLPRLKNQQDYLNRYFGARSVEERSALVEAWRAQQQQTA